MPLDRAHMTVASRITLPAYIVLFTVLGLNYSVTPISRLSESPTLAYADHILGLRVWGLMFLTTAALMAVALIVLHHRTLFRYALLVCAVCMTIWAVVFVLAALVSVGSPAGWVWPAFVAAACIASNRSLAAGER